MFGAAPRLTAHTSRDPMPRSLALTILFASSMALAQPRTVLAPAACPSALTVVTDTSWAPRAVVAAGNAGWNRQLIPGATWIWRDHSPNGTSVCLTRRFVVPAGCAVESATLVVGMDDRGEARLGGQ